MNNYTMILHEVYYTSMNEHTKNITTFTVYILHLMGIFQNEKKSYKREGIYKY